MLSDTIERAGKSLDTYDGFGQALGTISEKPRQICGGFENEPTKRALSTQPAQHTHSEGCYAA